MALGIKRPAARQWPERNASVCGSALGGGSHACREVAGGRKTRLDGREGTKALCKSYMGSLARAPREISLCLAEAKG